MQRISAAVQEGATRLPEPPVHDDRRRGVVLFVVLAVRSTSHGDRLRDRRHPLRRRRLHRHERVGARQRPRGRGRPRRRRARRSTSPSAAAPSPACSSSAWRCSAWPATTASSPRSSTSATKEAVDALDRPRLRRLADLGLRPTRRRHLHQGRRRRRRPRRQGRGRHPRGRPAQPGRDRRQRGRQRRRLRRHGGRPVRDLRGHRGRRDAARRPDVRSDATTRSRCTRSCSAASSIIASIIGTFAVRSTTGNVERALYQGLIVVRRASPPPRSTRSPTG